MNAWTDDIKQIGIPTAESGARHQRVVESMDVYSHVEAITTGTGLASRQY